MKQMIQKILLLLDKKNRSSLVKILLFSIFISLLEVIGVGIIMPFISVASDFGLINSNHYYNYIYNFFHFSTHLSFILSFGIILVVFYLLRSVLSLFYFYKLSVFSQGRYYFFANKLFHRYLNLYYSVFMKKNSTHMVKSIINEAQNLSLFISNLLFLISESIVVIFIYILLLIVNWQITLMITIFLFLNIFFLLKIISPRIKKAGLHRDVYQKEFYELLGNVFGNFKILKLRNNQNEIFHKFDSATYEFSNVNVIHSVFSQVPRLYLEAIGFSLISLIVLIVIYITQSDISSSLSLVTFFLLGLFRLIPSANRILSSYNNMLFYSRAVDIIFDDLSLKEEKFMFKEIYFKKSIELKGISFKYKAKNILTDVNLLINKNDKIAFVGESGSGKSTLVDIIMGLYPLDKGNIYIDANELVENVIYDWRMKIGYIPQNIYLFDGTVAHNVAMVEDYDVERVEKVLEQSKILNFLEEEHEGLQTNVGEGGVKLSGGQKQRIAIARALYSNPEILILDEATSALDEATELKIMDEIYELVKDKTLIVIAHRLSTIKGCNRVIQFENGKINEIENI